VIRRPTQRKQNQQVMNHWQSTSISGKRNSENLAGEGDAGVRAGKHAGPVVKALSAVRVSDAIVSND
jgi:hypothetical protein